jgi:hypothetical protein
MLNGAPRTIVKYIKIENLSWNMCIHQHFGNVKSYFSNIKSLFLFSCLVCLTSPPGRGACGLVCIGSVRFGFGWQIKKNPIQSDPMFCGLIWIDFWISEL